MQFIITKVLYGQLKKSTGIISKVNEGDLKTSIKESNIKELNDFNLNVNKLIEHMGSLVKDIVYSTEEAKQMASTVADTAKQSVETTNEISESSRIVAEGASKQAIDADICYSISNELITKVETVAESSKIVSSKADAVKQITQFGKNNINELISNSKLSEENMRNITRSVNELSKMAEDINGITEIITAIASQTNLLSLNASIEAVKVLWALTIIKGVKCLVNQ